MRVSRTKIYTYMKMSNCFVELTDANCKRFYKSILSSWACLQSQDLEGGEQKDQKFKVIISEVEASLDYMWSCPTKLKKSSPIVSLTESSFRENWNIISGVNFVLCLINCSIVFTFQKLWFSKLKFFGKMSK